MSFLPSQSLPPSLPPFRSFVRLKCTCCTTNVSRRGIVCLISILSMMASSARRNACTYGDAIRDRGKWIYKRS